MTKFKHFWESTLFRAFSLVALMICFVFFQQTFGADGFLNVRLLNNSSLIKWFVLWGIKLLLVIVADMFILSLFIQLRCLNGRLRYLFRGWTLWQIIGIGLSIFLCGEGSTVGMPQFLNAVFPVVRNSFSFFTGALLFGMVVPYLNIEHNEHRWKTALTIILALPMLGRDIWTFGNGFGLSAAILYGLIAVIPIRHTNRHALYRALVLIFAAFLSIPILASFSHWGVAANLSAGGQMVGMLSVFTVIPARLLLAWSGLDKPIQPALWRKVFCVSGMGLILLTTATPYKSLMSVLENVVITWVSRSHGLWIAFSAALIVVLALVFGCLLYVLLLHSRLWRLGDQIFDDSRIVNFLDLTPKQLYVSWHRVWRYVWPTFMTFGTFYLIQVISTFVSYPTLKQTGFGQIMSTIIPTLIFKRFPAMILGTVLLMCLFWILRGLISSFWFAYASVTTLSIAWCIANAIKVRARSEAILPADLYEVTAAGNLLNMVSPVVLVFALIGIAVLILICILAAKHFKPAKITWPVRVGQIVLAAGFLASFMFFNQPGAFSKAVATNFGVSMSNANELWMAQANGPFTEFARSLDVTVMTEPSGYSREHIDQLVKKYAKVARVINKGRSNRIDQTTVIFNLSESFSDPSRVPNLTLTKDPMPTIRALKKQTTSGLMMSYGYGGGTANMEWETLTGMSLGNLDKTLTTPYNQLVARQKQGAAITTQFPYSAAIHPYLASFYNRASVYKKFGFNKFENLDNKTDPIKYQKRLGKSPYLSDETAYRNALSQIRSHRGSQFINLVTMQNHMPYSANEYGASPYKMNGTAITDNATKASFETYAQGLKYTDEAVNRFVKQIDAIQKPIIWVFYGDHLAALYNGVDTIAKYAVQLHQTDYFVYANKYARLHGAKTKLTDAGQVGSSDFIALAYAQANAKVNPFVALLTKVQQDLPTIWTRSESTSNITDGMSFVNDSGKQVGYDSLSDKQKALLHDYQLLQYDIVAGKQYSLKAGFQSN